MLNDLNVIMIDFRDLRQNSRVSILLDEKDIRWCSAGDDDEDGVRFRIESPSQSTLSFKRFFINSREIYFETYGSCDSILHQVCVRGGADDLRGTVDLPPGASVTLRSLVDSTSVIGHSSFALSVKRER